MALDTVKFQTNIPEVVSLAFAKGKPVSSQFGGDQVMYSLEDGRRMYLPPFVAEKIEAAGISARMPFAICKREVNHGNRRSVEYQIETHNDAGDLAAGTVSPTAPARPNPKPDQDLQERLAQNNARVAPIQQQNKPSPAAAPAGAPDPDTAAMIEAHRRAIDVAAAAEAYAQERGLAVRYAAEDIRAIAATLFIQAAKGGAR